MNRLPGLIVQIRRRRVLRTAGIYIVGAWVVLQVADLAFESWGIPATSLRYVWTGLLLGFPVALIFGWRYDIIGARIVRTLPDGSTVDTSLQRTDFVILAALGVVAVATVWRVGVELSRTDSHAPEVRSALRIDPRSIAVLPFANRSRDQSDGDFLALGIQDDLLTRLSRIGALKVISRTSVERYRNSVLSSPEIGRELGIGKILEGSVLRAGDQIRVNVQLIDAVTDEHIWAHTYDRRLTASNIFSIQTEITDEIVQRLRAELTLKESARLSAMPTENLAAYTEYLKGKQQAEMESIESLNNAVGLFESAISLDPVFALAHVSLADAYLTLGANFLGGLDTAESIVLAEPQLARALELDADLGEAYASLGLMRTLQGNMAAAEEAYETAIALRPNYARVFRLYGRLRWQQNRREDALKLAEKALALDPFSATVNFDIARYLDVFGRFDEAMGRYLRVVELEPGHAFAYVYIAALHYLVHGRADESLVWYHKAADNDVLSPSLHAAPAIPYLELGRPESAAVWVERGLQLGPDSFWSRWTSLLLNVYAGDNAAAQTDARVLLEHYPRFWGALHLLRNADLEAGRHAVARARYARAYRELIEPELPEVDESNYFAAVDLAPVLLQLGERERANDLLQGSLDTLKDLPRLGTDGYWITDARIYAQQGKPGLALAALRTGIDQGWRVLAWYYLDHDPNFDGIRDEPEFHELRQRVAEDMAMQADRVGDLIASGELQAARELSQCYAAGCAR